MSRNEEFAQGHTQVHHAHASDFMDRFAPTEYGREWSQSMTEHPDFLYYDGLTAPWMHQHTVSRIDRAWDAKDYDEVGRARQEGLVDSLRSSGMQTPVSVHNKRVIDGHHRVVAALEAGVPVKYRELSDREMETDYPDLKGSG